MKVLHIFRCGLVSVGVVCFVAMATAQVVYEKMVTIQPIQVGNGSGGFANLPIYQAEAQKVWDQAKIYLNWLPATQFIDSNFYNIGFGYIASFDNLVTIPDSNLSPGNPNKGGSLTPNVVNMWFVNDLKDSLSNVDLAGQTSGGSIVIDNQGVALRVVIPHELGHTLLGDPNHVVGNGFGATNLMNVSATNPSSLSQIYPDGTLLKLENSQISAAKLSSYAQTYAIPEPQEYVLLSGILAGMFGYYRRRAQRRGQRRSISCD